MPKSQFTFANSRSIEFADGLRASFFCNELEEKNKFIYFRRGPFETREAVCGNDRFKIRKNLVRWNLTGENCPNGKAIWKVEQA